MKGHGRHARIKYLVGHLMDRKCRVVVTFTNGRRRFGWRDHWNDATEGLRCVSDPERYSDDDEYTDLDVHHSLPTKPGEHRVRRVRRRPWRHSSRCATPTGDGGFGRLKQRPAAPRSNVERREPMTYRFFARTGVVGTACAVLAFAPVAAAQQDAALRTPDGQPDLQGVWNFSTATPMERPAELGDQATLTAEEAAAWEAEIAEQRAGLESELEDAPLEARLGYSLRIWFEWGDALEERRTSLVIDPPDGRIPAVRPEVEARRALTRMLRGRHAHGPEDRGISERCLLGFNSGPPMTPSAYNNNMQLFQTADHVVLLNEMVHNARVIPLDGRPHLPADLRQWVGDSRASWDGDTLVIETRNFLRETSLGGSSANMRLVERFTRLDADTLRYEFTVSDPATWTGPWTARVRMTRSDEPLYEYACHEGNYSMPSSLSGARAMEVREAAEGAAEQP